MIRIATACAGFALTLGLLLAPAGAAQADDACTLAAPSRLAVSGPDRDVAAPISCRTSTGPVAPSFAGWEARPAGTGTGVTAVTAPRNTFELTDTMPRGVWTWTPLGASGTDGRIFAQTTYASDVRLATSGYLVLSRTGDTMSFYARTSRWSPYYGHWLGFPPAPASAVIQWRSNLGSWAVVHTLTPDSGGVTRGSFTVPADKTMHYRIVVPDSTTTGTFGTVSPEQIK